MSDVISAVNDLRQTIRTLRLDSNVGLNVISVHDGLRQCCLREQHTVRTAGSKH